MTMVRKTYTSKSIPHFSVGGRRIAFTPLSTRSSYFETTDETLQKKIEAHPWFGDKFILWAVDTLGEETAKNAAAEEKRKAELKEVRFTTLADAKDWLAANFGVVRSNIKKKDDAVNAGKANGVSVIFGVADGVKTEEDKAEG